MAFPYAHIAGPDYTVMLLLYGFPAVMFEQFALPDALEEYRRHGVTVAGGSTAFYSMFLAEQRKQPGRAGHPHAAAARGRRGAQAAGGLPRRRTGDGRAAHPRLRDDRGPDDHHGRAGRHGREPGDDGGPAAGGHGDTDVGGRGGAAAGRGRLPGVSGPGADRGGLRRGRASCSPATSGISPASGHLVLTGRLKDVIIRKGENISAKEIEDLLHRHPAVGDVAVIGLPDAERGERVCAVVEQPAGAGGADAGRGDVVSARGRAVRAQAAGAAGGGGRPSAQRDAAEGAQVQAAGTVRGAPPRAEPVRTSRRRQPVVLYVAVACSKWLFTVRRSSAGPITRTTW